MEYQNIKNFLEAPFGESNPKDYYKEYMSLRKANKIKIHAYTIIEDQHLIHVTVGSTSNPKENYDVVILFFTDNDTVKRELSLENYFIKFFSNSPSFIYQYAALYKQQGFLIDMLYDKMDKNYADVLPTKTNVNHEMHYDKSIYCTCKYLVSTYGSLSKAIRSFGKKTPERFFRDIKTFEDIKLTSEIKSLDKKIEKEIEEKKRSKKGRRPDPHKKDKIVQKTTTMKSGVKSSITKSKVIRPKGPKMKKKASLTTKKER